MAKILLGADHAGYSLKEKLKDFLEAEGIDYEDMTPELVEGDDYPDAARKVAEKVAKGKDKGVLLCGTGIGVSIAANKVKGVRAARVSTINDARLAKRHNNANIITFGGQEGPSSTEAKKIVKAWLSENFEKGRHSRRVKKISDLESE